MRIRGRLLSFAVLLTVAFLLAGCIGDGGKKDQTVAEFIVEMEKAFASLDAEKIADIIYFPIVLPDLPEDSELEQIVGESDKITRDMFVTATKDAFKALRDGGASLELDVRDGYKVVESGNTAVVSEAVFELKGAVKEEIAGQAVLKLIEGLSKVGELDLPDGWEDAVKPAWEVIAAMIKEANGGEWPEEFEDVYDEIEFELKKADKKWKLYANPEA